METKKVVKPSQVGTAVNLLWASLAIGFVKSLVYMLHLDSQALPVITNFIFIFVIALMVLLIVFISKGKNWARITFLVLFILGTPPSILSFLKEFARSTVLGAFGIVQIIFQTIALYLLFTKPGSGWFKKQKN